MKLAISLFIVICGMSLVLISSDLLNTLSPYDTNIHHLSIPAINLACIFIFGAVAMFGGLLALLFTR